MHASDVSDAVKVTSAALDKSALPNEETERALATLGRLQKDAEEPARLLLRLSTLAAPLPRLADHPRKRPSPGADGGRGGFNQRVPMDGSDFNGIELRE